jgi:nicotinamidase-related amidase
MLRLRCGDVNNVANLAGEKFSERACARKAELIEADAEQELNYEARARSPGGNTDLEVLLRDVSAPRLIVTGIVTNACVETTTSSAAMRAIDVTILEDWMTRAAAADGVAGLDVGLP